MRLVGEVSEGEFLFLLGAVFFRDCSVPLAGQGVLFAGELRNFALSFCSLGAPQTRRESPWLQSRSPPCRSARRSIPRLAEPARGRGVRKGKWPGKSNQRQRFPEGRAGGSRPNQRQCFHEKTGGLVGARKSELGRYQVARLTHQDWTSWAKLEADATGFLASGSELTTHPESTKTYYRYKHHPVHFRRITPCLAEGLQSRCGGIQQVRHRRHV